MDGLEVYKEKIGEDEVVIRYPKNGDSPAMCEYINALSQEKTFITFQGEVINPEDEEKYLQSQLKHIEEKKVAQLLLFVNGKLSGISEVKMFDRIKAHVGLFGITIANEQRGKGFGKLLMQNVINEAKNNLIGLKIITLDCFAENEKALSLYKSFGFMEYGRLPEGNLYKDGFSEDVSMYLKV